MDMKMFFNTGARGFANIDTYIESIRIHRFLHSLD